MSQWSGCMQNVGAGIKAWKMYLHDATEQKDSSSRAS